MNKVLSEVYAIVMAMGEKWRVRIAPDVWQDIIAKKDNDYNPYIDPNKDLVSQNIQDDTITFIAMLHKDYWCDTPEEKASLLAIFDKNQEEWEARISNTSGVRGLLKAIHKN